MEVLTFNVDADRRGLVKDVQDFNVDFNDSKYNWIQARQYENQMRQAQVNVIHADGTPFDLTGANVVFEGVLPDKTHRVIDARHGTIIDATSGQFRFDFPAPVFAVAGSYQQSFFRIYRNGQNIATLEFCLEVLADKVISGIVPSDYLTPFEDLYAKLGDIIANADGDFKAKLIGWQTQINELITNLNGDYASIKLLVTGLQSQLDDIAQKIKDGNIVTAKDLTDWEDEMEQAVNSQIDIDSSMVVGGFVSDVFEGEVDRIKAKLNPDLFTFAQMNDTHWEDIMRSQPYAPRSLAHIRNLLSFADVADLLLLNGDNNNSDNVDLNVVKHEIGMLTSLFFDGNTGGRANRFIQLGNHDDGTTRRMFQPNYFIAQNNYLHDDFLRNAYRTSENQGEIRNNGSLYFYKDYPDKKIRLISLNTSDILEGQLDDSGSQKYDRWGTHAIRQEQMNWLINIALKDVPADYHTIVTCHAPLDLTGKEPNAKTHYWNFDVVLNILAAFKNGTAYLGSSADTVDTDYRVVVNANFTNQGPRPLVGNFAGHVHEEYIHTVNDISCVAVDRSLVDVAKAADIGTAQEDMFDVIQIDTANRHVYVYGFGGSTDRGFNY